jgi:hypothetical protein
VDTGVGAGAACRRQAAWASTQMPNPAIRHTRLTGHTRMMRAAT